MATGCERVCVFFFFLKIDVDLNCRAVVGVSIVYLDLNLINKILI